MTGKSAVNASVWFDKVNAEGIVTRQAADPLNVKIPAARLELRKNFSSVRVCKEWTSIRNDTVSKIPKMREAFSMPTGDTRVITRPKLRSGHERRQTDEQDETRQAIPHRALLGPMGINRQEKRKQSMLEK